MNAIRNFFSGSGKGKSLVILALVFIAAIGLRYFYETGKLKEPMPKSAPQKTETKTDNTAVLPKDRMEDGPPLEDLPTLPNVPLPPKKTDLIKIESLHAGDAVLSPLTVTGQARGNWFFEASFPIKALDANGKVIGMGNGRAEGEWMTENFVPWEATISFIAPASGGGEVVFMKDNPSGLPQHDAEVRVPVVFAHPQ
jgi:hypothetical protein